MINKIRVAALIGALVAAPLRLAAHHAFAAEFQQDKPLSLRGVISRIDWVNPHVYIYLDVAGEDGKIVTWALETGGPGPLTRLGWTSDLFKVGDRVIAGGFLAKRSL